MHRLCLALVAIITMAACAPPAPPRQMLNAKLRMGRTGLELSNDTSDTWRQIVITVRSKAGGTAYRKHLDTMKPRESVRFSLDEFVNASGERFNPTTTSVHHTTVDATADGVDSSVMFEGNQ